MTETKRIDPKRMKQNLEAAVGGRLLDLSGSQLRELLLVAGPIFLLVVGAFFAAYQFVEPAPPRTVVMTTGGEAGAYHAFARRYAARLRNAGIELRVVPSAGSLENLARLRDPASLFGAGLVQGGISSKAAAPELLSLGRIFLEPVWVFHRGDSALDRLGGLAGKTIAVGPAGSGTRTLAVTLLEAAGVDANRATLSPLSGAAAVEALGDGRVDALFLVAAAEAPVVRTALGDPRFRLMSLAHAEALTRLFPYLTRVTLPRGSVDLVRDIPTRDMDLVAPMATLLVKSDLHPAIVGLLVEAVQDVHTPGGMFQRHAEFPKAYDPEYEMSEDAARYYRDGPSFLKRFLPFWLATLIERTMVLIVPIATLVLPLVKLGPMLYEWRIRRRLLYWYGRLKSLDAQIGARVSPEQAHVLAGEIRRIDDAVANIPMPISYSQDYYDLRSAIDWVEQRLTARLIEPRDVPEQHEVRSRPKAKASRGQR
jgi:TRAP transporter TAXI family solute receptor